MGSRPSRPISRNLGPHVSNQLQESVLSQPISSQVKICPPPGVVILSARADAWSEHSWKLRGLATLLFFVLAFYFVAQRHLPALGLPSPDPD